jgi:hypothetical protein
MQIEKGAAHNRQHALHRVTFSDAGVSQNRPTRGAPDNGADVSCTRVAA